MVELTGLERMVVLNNHVLRRTLLLLTNKQLQLQLLHLPQIPLPLVQLRIVHLACRHLPIFGILQLNMLASLQVRISIHLRAVLTSVKKTIEPVNKGRFSNQNVILSMRRQKPNHGQRSEHRLTLQSAVAECQMLRNF
jgi:hypothetical protein